MGMALHTAAGRRWFSRGLRVVRGACSALPHFWVHACMMHPGCWPSGTQGVPSPALNLRSCHEVQGLCPDRTKETVEARGLLSCTPKCFVHSGGQKGLLGAILLPDFQTTGYHDSSDTSDGSCVLTCVGTMHGGSRPVSPQHLSDHVPASLVAGEGLEALSLGVTC